MIVIIGVALVVAFTVLELLEGVFAEERVCQVKCVSFYFLGDRFYLVTLLHDKLVKWQFFLRILTAFGSPGNIPVNKVTRNGNAIFYEQCESVK